MAKKSLLKWVQTILTNFINMVYVSFFCIHYNCLYFQRQNFGVSNRSTDSFDSSFDSSYVDNGLCGPQCPCPYNPTKSSVALYSNTSEHRCFDDKVRPRFCKYFRQFWILFLTNANSTDVKLCHKRHGICQKRYLPIQI